MYGPSDTGRVIRAGLVVALPRRQGEQGQTADDGAPIYVTSECNRQVLLAVRNVDVTDYEIITAYQQLPDGRVMARQRTAVFLDPRQASYFEAAGRAVALYDATLHLERLKAPNDAPPGAVACVLTPKDVEQCV